MNKKTLSLIGMALGAVFVLVGVLSLCGALGGNTSYPGSAPYTYDSGYASFGADFYSYSVNNAAEAASAARTAASNLEDIAGFLKVFCGLFSIGVGAVISCGFGIYHVGLKEAAATLAFEAAQKEETVAEETTVEETVINATEEVVAEDTAEAQVQ